MNINPLDVVDIDWKICGRMDPTKYGVLVIGCHNKEPVEIIKLITGHDVNHGNKFESGMLYQPWAISNKYYTADVFFCVLKNKMIHTEVEVSIQAIILYFDGTVGSLFELDDWLQYIKDYNTSVNIAVCNNFSDEEKENNAQMWCIENAFELVALKPNIDQTTAFQDDMQEEGIERVVLALHAHVWPNLVMKDKYPHDDSDKLLTEIENQVKLLDIEAHTIDNFDEMTEAQLSNSTDLFDSILSNLCKIKSQVSQMDSKLKVDTAEKIVSEIWNSINIDGQSTDSD